jgi:hypothetical protein
VALNKLKNILPFQKACFIFYAFGLKLIKLKNCSSSNSILPRKLAQVASDLY